MPKGYQQMLQNLMAKCNAVLQFKRLAIMDRQKEFRAMTEGVEAVRAAFLSQDASSSTNYSQQLESAHNKITQHVKYV